MAHASQELKKKLTPEINRVLSKYGMKGTISVRNRMTLVVTVRSGFMMFDQTFVNTCHIDKFYEGVQKEFLLELKLAMEGPNFFNHDDASTDYFNRSHYIDIKIGTWEKPYVIIKPKEIKVKSKWIQSINAKMKETKMATNKRTWQHFINGEWVNIPNDRTTFKTVSQSDPIRVVHPNGSWFVTHNKDKAKQFNLELSARSAK